MQRLDIMKEIMESLYTFERILQSYQNTPRQYGTEEHLYMTDAHAIKEIGKNPRQNLNELAEKTLRTKSGMSMLVKNLSELGLVDRHRDDKDNRRYELTLTEKGRIVYETHEALDNRNFSNYLLELDKKKHYTIDELIDISEFLGALVTIINRELNEIET